MHELGLAEGILAVVLDAAHGERVERVRVRVGTLQRVVPDSLRFCFQLASQETAAAGAILDLEEVPARLRCRSCQAESVLAGGAFACRACGTFEVDVVGGAEASVTAVKVASGWRRRPRASRAVAKAR